MGVERSVDIASNASFFFDDTSCSDSFDNAERLYVDSKREFDNAICFCFWIACFQCRIDAYTDHHTFDKDHTVHDAEGRHTDD